MTDNRGMCLTAEDAGEAGICLASWRNSRWCSPSTENVNGVMGRRNTAMSRRSIAISPVGREQSRPRLVYARNGGGWEEFRSPFQRTSSASAIWTNSLLVTRSQTMLIQRDTRGVWESQSPHCYPSIYPREKQKSFWPRMERSSSSSTEERGLHFCRSLNELGDYPLTIPAAVKFAVLAR